MAVIGFPSAAHTGHKTIKKTRVKENTITWYSIVDEDKILPILCDIFMRRTNIKFLVIWSIINFFCMDNLPRLRLFNFFGYVIIQISN